MPTVFLSHQAPLLPLKMRWPDRVDGLALMVVSIVPDLWLGVPALRGPFGYQTSFDAHDPARFIQLVVLPGVVLAMALRANTMPVVPLVLPRLGVFRLREYRLLGRVRYPLQRTVLGVAVGGASHLLLDSFTEDHGWFVRNVEALRGFWFELDGRPILTYHIVRFLLDLLLASISIRLLVRIGRERRQWAWHGRRHRPARDHLEDPAHSTVVGLLIMATGAAVAAGYLRGRADGWFCGLMAATLVWLVASIGIGFVGQHLRD